MNRHFEDTVYYAKRMVETAKKGVRREFAPVEAKVRSVTGREQEPEPGRVGRVKARLSDARARVAGEAGRAVDDVRETVGEYRSGRARSE